MPTLARNLLLRRRWLSETRTLPWRLGPNESAPLSRVALLLGARERRGSDNATVRELRRRLAGAAGYQCCRHVADHIPGPHRGRSHPHQRRTSRRTRRRMDRLRTSIWPSTTSSVLARTVDRSGTRAPTG